MLVISNTHLISISSQSVPLVIICKKKASGDFYMNYIVMFYYLSCNYEGIFRQNDGNCDIVYNFVSNHLTTSVMIKRLQILHCQGSIILFFA